MGKHTVLVVEDEEMLRRLLEYRLGKQHDVKGASNGKEAMRLIKESRPDLIVSDIMMPVMDGFELYDRLQDEAATRVIPFIFLTARNDEPTRREARRMGADDYITKPFDIAELLIRAARLLERVDYYRGESQEHEENTSKLEVFLAHAKEDKLRVRKIYDLLKSRGVNPWMDDKDLLPGQDWQLEIEKAIQRSHVVLVFLSDRAVNKRGYVQKEIRMALDAAEHEPEGAIFVIPVKLEECKVPRRLGESQWIEFFGEGNSDGQRDQIVNDLMRALKQRAIALTGVRPPRLRPE